MLSPFPRTSLARVAAPLLAASGLAGGAFAQQQVHFSVDWMGPTVGMPDAATGTPITEGDVLIPTGPAAIGFAPLPVPSTAFHAGVAPIPGLGLFGHPGCVGHPGGTPCIVEVDALSFGQDQQMLPGVPIMNTVAFSTDEFAVGFAGMPAPPTIWTEAPVGDLCADVLVDAGLGVFPSIAPFGAAVPGSVAILDGNGAVSGSPALYPGIGLIEPRPPSPLPAKPGDNLDALEIDPISPVGVPPLGFFFSLDAPWVDPLTGIPNTASAAAHGFSGGDVLHTPIPGAAPLVYAPAPVLGLDLVGPNQDDLDALILVENGIPGYQPSMQPGDWGPGGGSDMLLFSVRRGSFVIGMPDSLSGMPIEEGDVLSTPIPTVLGGLSPFPSIVIAAENLGLATLRSGAVGPFGDDLNALDSIKPLNDCNGNGIEDAVDIALGGAADVNANGIPDTCEPTTGITLSCFCPAALAPCANGDPTAGCANSTGVGALLTTAGSASVGADDLVLTATQAPINVNGLLFMGSGTVLPTPFGDGLRCVGGTLGRWPFQNSGATGTFSYGPGLSAFSIANFPISNHLLAGTTWNFQIWYRDPPGPCGNGFNLSNMATVPFVP